VTIEDEAGEQPGVVVTRFIPVPKSVSVEAQQFLGMDLSAMSTIDELEPTDKDGWRAQFAATNEMLAGVLESLATVPVELETITVEGVQVFVVVPAALGAEPDLPVYFDIHGGGFTIGAGETGRVMAKGTAARTGMKIWAPDYRMPPDHPYPAALDDCVAAYRGLLDVQSPDRIIVGGGSAGGNLAAALVLRARAEGLPLPAALVLMSPESDLTESGDSFATNRGVDNVLISSLAPQIALYADGHDLTDPYLSPHFGDYTPPFPPTLLQTGTRDLLLSNTVRLHRKLRNAGVDAELHVFEAMPHGGFFGAPEDDEVGVEIRRFLTTHLLR
jgi:monoterpene epsilon-lactone hydrolase